MKTKNIYYKIVDKDLKSVIMNPNRKIFDPVNSTISKKYCVTYKENEWVRPILYGSKLMVFNNLNSVKLFIHNNRIEESWFIYECSIKNPCKYGFMTFLIDDASFEDKYHSFIKLIKNKKKRSNFVIEPHIPLGTIFCSAVKLLKRIQ